MDDRDKDLTGLFVRDLDEIPLPARGAWRRVSGRESNLMRASRTIVAAGAAIAVLAIALLIGVQLRDRSTTAANPSASPTPSASGAGIVVPSASATPGTSAPSATPAPGGAVYNDDFGFIIQELSTVPTISPGATATIRKESSSVTIGSIQHQYFAVSPDGTQIAYWTVKSAGETSRLQIVSVASPQTPVASSSLSQNEDGGLIIWANDSSGVAYALITAGPPTQTGPPAITSTIRTFNTRPGSSGPSQVVVQWNETGRFIQPIAWDRASNTLAAGVTGDGGFMTDYILANTATPQATAKRTPVNGRITLSSVRPSTDAKFMVGTDIDSGFSYWPLADYSAKVAPAESKYWQAGVLWRPGTHELGFIGPSNQFWLCNVERNTPLGCGVTAFSGVPAGATVRTFRADGGAVLLAVSAGGGAQTTYTLVTFTNGPLGGKVTGGERVTFQEVGGLRTSVRFR